jgi:hypothetical protein
MRQLLSAEPWDLVVLDEAHHARRKSPQDRKETPNRLLELMTQLKEKTNSLKQELVTENIFYNESIRRVKLVQNSA